MKLLKIFLIIFFIFNFTQLNSVENNNELINKISKNIRCLICQGQSVYDSQSDFALSMKLVIEKKLNEGLKEKEIYEYLLDQYGQWITYDPEFNQKTLILWTLPILLFIVGGAIIFRKLIVLK
jgi:cytochrome c-type biogenesis protein CcmH